MMNNWNGTGGSGWWIVMCITMMVAMGGIALALAFGLRGRPTAPPTDPPGAPTPRAILDERLARGEITPAQHHELVEALGRKPSVPAS